jgi:ketosteroid isomerase-like protein
VSQENVEICKRAFEALGVHRDTEAALPYLDPEVELRSAIIGGAEGITYRGHEGVRDWMIESDATFGELRLEPEEWRDTGDDVLLLGRLHARGRESGVEVESAIAWLLTLRGGDIVRMRGYLNPQEALEAAGLSE